MQTQGIVPLILPVHIIAGVLALVFGYVALSAAKGATLHRKSGMIFVCVMLTLSVTGMLISAVEGVAPAINVPSSLPVIYLVITSLTTVRPAAAGLRWLDRAAMLMALGIGVGCFALAVGAIVTGGREAGLAYPLVMFGVVSQLASAGDRRMIRAGFPKPLVALPVLAVLAIMFYWLWRLRVRHNLRGVAALAPQATTIAEV